MPGVQRRQQNESTRGIDRAHMVCLTPLFSMPRIEGLSRVSGSFGNRLPENYL